MVRITVRWKVGHETYHLLPQRFANRYITRVSDSGEAESIVVK